MDEQQVREEPIGTYEAKSGGVSAKVILKARIIDNELVGPGFTRQSASGDDYYFSDISFEELNYDINRSIKYSNRVNFYLGCSGIGQIFEMLRENASSIADLLDPRSPKDSKWHIVKCVFSLEDQTKHLYQERAKAKELRRQMPPSE